VIDLKETLVFMSSSSGDPDGLQTSLGIKLGNIFEHQQKGPAADIGNVTTFKGVGTK